jgi:hypothetical protein
MYRVARLLGDANPVALTQHRASAQESQALALTAVQTATVRPAADDARVAPDEQQFQTSVPRAM